MVRNCHLSVGTREALPDPFFPDLRSITLIHHLGFLSPQHLDAWHTGDAHFAALCSHLMLSDYFWFYQLLLYTLHIWRHFSIMSKNPALKNIYCSELDVVLHLQALLSPCLAFYVKC